MTSENLVTAPVGTDLETAERILQEHRIEKLPLVDENGRLSGLITIKDIEKVTETEKGGATEQLMLDFREPVEPPKRKRRTVKRGIAG